MRVIKGVLILNASQFQGSILQLNSFYPLSNMILNFNRLAIGRAQPLKYIKFYIPNLWIHILKLSQIFSWKICYKLNYPFHVENVHLGHRRPSILQYTIQRLACRKRPVRKVVCVSKDIYIHIYTYSQCTIEPIRPDFAFPRIALLLCFGIGNIWYTAFSRLYYRLRDCFPMRAGTQPTTALARKYDTFQFAKFR